MHAQRYTNPVHPRPFADPCVVRLDDGYLAVGAGAVVGGRVFEVLRSPDLVRWVSTGGALESLPVAPGTDHRGPELLAAQGSWWLYYAVGSRDAGYRLRVAVAAAPDGPYEDCGVDLAPDEPSAVDPYPFTDADGGLTLFYARPALAGPRSTSIAAVRMASPTRPAGPAVTVLVPGADPRPLAAPCVVRRDGRHHLLHEAGVAVADDPLGPWTVRTPGGPLLRSVPGHVVRPGHGSVVTTPDGLDVLAYHAWDAALRARRLCVDPLRWTPDGPVVDGPTWWETSLPR